MLLISNKSLAVAEMGDRGHNRHGPKSGRRLLCPFRGGGAGSPSNIMWPALKSTAVPYQVASSSIQPFGHNRHGPKTGGAMLPFWGGGAGPRSNIMSLEAYLPTTWHLDPSSHLATTDMGQNWRTPPPFWGGGGGSPSNTMWPGPRPTCTPSFIWIRPTVWPQYTKVTDRIDRTDNGSIA